MTIVLLDGELNAAVACTRSLARAGHAVIVGYSNRLGWCKAGLSRFASSTFGYPDPQWKPDEFVNTVVAQIKRQAVCFVLPLAEQTILALAGNHERMRIAGGQALIPRRPEAVRVCDKQQMTALAASLGIRTPQTIALPDTKTAEEVASRFVYPAVLKCRSSVELLADGRVAMMPAPRYARNADQFLQAYRELGCKCSCVLAQEFIRGEGVGYFALTCHGELRAEFAHLRLREVKPSGSGSSLRKSIAVSARLRASGLPILQELKWHGVAMVEFRMQPDGTPVFMEVNPRFWNSLALAVHAGMDFPALFVRMADQGDVTPYFDYRVDVRCRWLLGDLFHLLEVLRGAPAGYPGVFPNRWRTLINLLIPVRGTVHDNFVLNDPLPAIGDWIASGTRLWQNCHAALTEASSRVRITSIISKIAQ
jgi:predicted ATP-grasp superfamily ATP-dependent carboligase